MQLNVTSMETGNIQGRKPAEIIMGKVIGFDKKQVSMARSSLYLVFIVWFYLHCCTPDQIPADQWAGIGHLRASYDWTAIPLLNCPVLGFAITVMESLSPETSHSLFLGRCDVKKSIESA